MTCTEFQQILPDVIDRPVAGAHAAHLISCASCSDLVADLRAISEGAKQLGASDEPNPRVWANIQRILEAEGLIRTPRQPGGVLVPATRSWFSWAWASWAAMAVVAISILLSTNHPKNSSDLAKTEVRIPPVTAHLAPTAAIAEDDLQLLSEISPAMRTAYEDNLKNVNAFIQDAEQSVAQDPNDDEARHFLMDAYQQKEMVYQLAMDRSMQ